MRNYTLVNIDTEWLDTFFDSNSLTYQVIDLFTSATGKDVDTSKLSGDLKKIHYLEFKQFKSTYNAKKDKSCRISLLPSLVSLLDGIDNSDLNKFILALNDYKINRCAPDLANRYLNSLFFKESKIIDKYYPNPVDGEVVGFGEVTIKVEVTEFDTEDLPTEEEFFNPEPIQYPVDLFVEEASEGTSELNEITGSVEISSDATKEQIEALIDAVRFDDEELIEADDSIGMMYNRNNKSIEDIKFEFFSKSSITEYPKEEVKTSFVKSDLGLISKPIEPKTNNIPEGYEWFFENED
jgi:hypothetical protein